MPNNTEFEKLLPPFIKDALGPGHRLVQTELLQGDASQRTYFRVTTEETLTQTQKSYIVMHSNQVDSELNSFIDVHKALTHLEIPVPALFYSDKASGLLLEEDCGDWTLEQFSKTISEKEVDSLYKKALDILVRMQFGDRHNTFTCIAYTRYFDAEKFMQELNFMRTHLLEGLAGHRVEATDLRKITKAFNALCMELAREPRVFTHRDFHSKNLMVQQNGKVQVLDFQDARMGPCQYDLVSLLNDSYSPLLPEHIKHLVEYYLHQVTGTKKQVDKKRFERIFDLATIQRSLKAAGTFAFQKVVRKNDKYQKYINPALQMAFQTMDKHNELFELQDLLYGYVQKFKDK